MLDCCAASRECSKKDKKKRKPIQWKCAYCFDTHSKREWKGALVSHQLFQFCSEICWIQWLEVSNKEQLLKSPVLTFALDSLDSLDSLNSLDSLTPPIGEVIPPSTSTI